MTLVNPNYQFDEDNQKTLWDPANQAMRYCSGLIQEGKKRRVCTNRATKKVGKKYLCSNCAKGGEK